MQRMALKKNDIIDIVAPSSGCAETELQNAVLFVESMGLQARYDKDFLKNQMYLAQSDDFRLKDLKKALMAKDSKVVWTIRGGYGSIRLLPMMQKWKKPNQTKVFWGLSDLTCVHNFLNQKWNWKTIHGPGLSRLGSCNASDIEKQQCEQILFAAKDFDMSFKNLQAFNAAATKVKNIEAKMTGGNMCTMYSLLASPWQTKTKNKIVFLEDVTERPYRIDRMLYSFKNAKIFDDAAAIILGDFTLCEEANHPEYLQNTLKDFFSKLKLPCFSGLESGHGKVQQALIFNEKSKLQKKGNEFVLTQTYKGQL